MAISVTDARISDKGRIELQISASATDVAGYLNECEEELARTGGIIPDGRRETLVARYGGERLQQLTNDWLMDRIGVETLGSSENTLVGFQQFALVENGYPEGPFIFQVATYELPKGTLSSADPLMISKDLARMAKEDDIDHAMKSLKRAYASQRVVGDVRPVKLGDTVKVDIEITAGGVNVAAMSKKGTALKLDYLKWPANFIDQLVGMQPGDEKDFSFFIPGIDGIAPDERFDAHVNLVALYFVDEPQFTPTWIQGKFPGLKNEADLRNAMAKNVANRWGGYPSIEDAMDVELFSRLSVEIPDELVEFVVDGVWRAELQRIHQQNMDLEMYCASEGTTPEAFREKVRANAERDLKITIALDALYEMKGFTLKESDVDTIFEQMAPGRAAEMKHSYILSGRLRLVEEIAQRAKARRWLGEESRLV